MLGKTHWWLPAPPWAFRTHDSCRNMSQMKFCSFRGINPMQCNLNTRWRPRSQPSCVVWFKYLFVDALILSSRYQLSSSIIHPWILMEKGHSTEGYLLVTPCSRLLYMKLFEYLLGSLLRTLSQVHSKKSKSPKEIWMISDCTNDSSCPGWGGIDPCKLNFLCITKVVPRSHFSGVNSHTGKS